MTFDMLSTSNNDALPEATSEYDSLTLLLEFLIFWNYEFSSHIELYFSVNMAVFPSFATRNYFIFL